MQTSHQYALLVICVLAGGGLALLPSREEVAPPTATTPTELEAALAAATSESALQVPLKRCLGSDKSPAAWVHLGDAIAQWQRDTNDARAFDWAEATYAEALRQDEKCLNALLGMAWVTGGRHEFAESRAWSNKALALDAQCAGALGFLGDAALEQGETEAALDYYQKMMDSKPDLSSWSRGAHALWIAGDSGKAQWLMQKAIASGGPHAENTAWCRATLAEMLWHDGVYAAARQAVEPALAQPKPILAARLMAARIALSENKLPEAEKQYLAILEENSDAKALAGLMEVQLAQGRPADAEVTFQRLQKSFKAETQSHGHDHSFQAKILADHDRELTAALRLVERIKLTQNPREADTLAWVNFKNNRMPEAIDAIKRALKHGTPDAEIHFHAGLIAEKFGDLDAARRHLQKALQMNPRFHPRHAEVALRTLQTLGNRATLTSAPENSTN